MDGVRAELAEAASALKRLRDRAERQTRYRDEVIVKAMRAGVTWREIQQITGLTSRGVKLARDRATRGTS